MKTKSLRIAAAGLTGALALTVGMGAGLAGTAGASVTSLARAGGLAGQKLVCDAHIDQRVIALQGLEDRIDATQHLTADQKAPMVASIDQSITLLNTVYRSAVAGATTKATLKSACQSVFIDLRIFAVYLPQETYSGDLDALGNAQTTLQGKVDAAKTAGTDTTTEQAQLDDATTKVADAQPKIASVTPASFNADPAGTQATWDAVRSDIFGAYVDLIHVHDELKAAGVAV
jgi:hypothetical protein